jgi:hypothetical protein
MTNKINEGKEKNIQNQVQPNEPRKMNWKVLQ